MKKIMLGTSDTWLMSHSSHRPSEPAYYIEDCRISGVERGEPATNLKIVKFLLYIVPLAINFYISVKIIIFSTSSFDLL